MKLYEHIQLAKVQIVDMLMSIRDAIQFISEENLLKGFLEHKWIMTATGLIAAFFSILVFTHDYTDKSTLEESSQVNISGTTEALDKLKDIGEMAFFSGGTKYLLIIFLEIIIFYFASRTLSILSNEDKSPALKDFINAEKRMIKVMFRNFIKALVFQIMAMIPLSILGLSSFKPIVSFIIHAYFIGFAFLDNYNEQFEKTVKESGKIIWQNKYASFTIGALISGLLHIPIIGAIVTPFIGSVSTTIYAFNNQINEDYPISDQ